MQHGPLTGPVPEVERLGRGRRELSAVTGLHLATGPGIRKASLFLPPTFATMPPKRKISSTSPSLSPASRKTKLIKSCTAWWVLDVSP